MGVVRRLGMPGAVIGAGLLTIASAGVVVAQRAAGGWADNLGGPSSSHHVDLDQVTKLNVGQLDVAWSYPYGNPGFNPIVVDDTMYVSGRNNSLIALDATNGKELWIHEGIPDLSARGVNYWQNDDGSDRRLIFTTGVFLQELDARTGASITTFGTGGFVDMRTGLQRGERSFRTPNPGKVYQNLVIMGSATGEGWMSPPGDIRAYDVITGKLAWQFHTVPLPGEFGYETWPPDAYKYVGGANTWGEMSIDDARGIVYLPTGSGTYDFYGGDRHGANLFADCLLALDAKTGKRLWHFQSVHHDLWDYDNASAPQLVTIRHNGEPVDVVAMAGKTGFLYVFNRVTGAPIWPIEERAVPKSDVPGEESWPTQPFPTVVPPFARQTFTAADINPWLLTTAEQDDLRRRLPAMRNEGLFTPPSQSETVSMPGNQGGSNWGTTAATPDKGLVYVLSIDAVAILRLEDVRKKVGGFQLERQQDGQAAYRRYCSECHGRDPRSPVRDTPSLVGVTNRLPAAVIASIASNGFSKMRPVPGVTRVEVTSIVDYLSGFSTGVVTGGLTNLPAGPVVASGGVATPGDEPPAVTAYPGNGANGGNAAYPDGVATPATRYVSEWGMMATATKPPYSTLTAYDLNTGKIRWQSTVGDDPDTVKVGGPTGTGSPMMRNGIISTKSGLVFIAGNDGKMRAYDEDNGKVLWTGPLPGPSWGVPVSYQAKGRQYIVVPATPPGPRTAAAVGDAPRGYIAFALPQAAARPAQP